MAEIKLDLNDENIKLAVEEAILRSLDAGAREALIRDALRYLTTPDPQAYGNNRNRSPLAQQFQWVVERTVQQIGEQLLAPGQPMRVELDRYVSTALADWISAENDAFHDALGHGIAAALKKPADD